MAVDWTKYDLIDDYNWDVRRGPDAITARYRITSANFASYKPAIGDNGPAGSVASTYYVERCQANSYAPGYLIASITFVSSLAPNRSSKASSSELDSEHLTDEAPSSILHFAPEWYSVRRWGGIGGVVYLGGIDSDLVDWTPDRMTPNGVQISAATWDALTVPPKSCPFTKIPHYDYVNRRVRLTVIKLTSYLTAANAVSDDFRGVNATGSIPSDYDVPDRTTAGVWRAASQVTRNITTRDGSSYVKVCRYLERAPKIVDKGGSNNLVWDAAKNGGLMTW